jgi:hypothetical protein
LGVEKEIECFRTGKSLRNDKYLRRFKRNTTAGTCTQGRTAVMMIIIIPGLALLDHLMLSGPCVNNFIRAGHQRQHQEIDDKEVRENIFH